jgi:hypothetical protein
VDRYSSLVAGQVSGANAVHLNVLYVGGSAVLQNDFS